jgi:hypothetical protein
MAFKKLQGCDSSDMVLWAMSPMAQNFLTEIGERRDVALRKLIKSPTEESAAVVRAYDHVTSLLEEAQKLK